MSEKKIAVLGLGYVGLPLALELSFSLSIKGFDINNNRINQLRKGIDSTLEVDQVKLLSQQKKKSFFLHNQKMTLRIVIFLLQRFQLQLIQKKNQIFQLY